jgi:hypothetical protein
MRTKLFVLFSAIFVCMVMVLVRSSLQMGILAAIPSFSANPWAVATLWDAYCGFLIFYVWVAWREGGWGARVIWFVLIMGLGNLATSGYLLWRVWQMKPGDGVQSLLLGAKLAEA